MTEEVADLLTIQEVADRLRVDATTVRRWVKVGILEAVILPHPGHRKSYRVRASTIEALLQLGGPINA